MSFRGRLRLFFAMIVVVPMIGVAAVLFVLTANSERGKTDAGIATGLRTALALYTEAGNRADPHLRAVAGDPELRAAIAARRYGAADRRMSILRAGRPRIVSLELRSASGRLLARSGARRTVAPAIAPLESRRGRRLGTLSVSITRARPYADRVATLTGLDVSVFRDGRRLASTVRQPERPAELTAPGSSHDFELRGRDYRGRAARVREAEGSGRVDIAVFREGSDLASAITSGFLVIAGVLLASLLLALALSVVVARALQGQIGEFLSAARRLAQGDFEHPVPADGHDEFAALGREFNSMSEQLAAQMQEVERKRQELEDTIRRVGQAFASGFDRQSVVELAVHTAIDACDAHAGRALPVDTSAFAQHSSGLEDESLAAALEAAERQAFSVSPDVGEELLEAVDASAPRPAQRPATEAGVDGAHALAVPMRARLGSRSSAQYVGVIGIARRGDEFSRQDRELLEYLAGQAVVSIENADLHETVQRQAVTDELTGLANVRELYATLEREIERSRRFSTPVGLVLLDIDNFKRVNDSYGHQQGDEVLAAVAGVLRDLSRDIDRPARYGGEELAVVLPETDATGAAQLAERMREAIERLRVPRTGEPGYLQVTASFGVSSIPESATDERSVIASADAALYRAKRAGKNRVELADPVAAPR